VWLFIVELLNPSDFDANDANYTLDSPIQRLSDTTNINLIGTVR